tara:strand:- start:286 stop:570 length:285 start_codon:yes stop_codon:yes gene_type:complete
MGHSTFWEFWGAGSITTARTAEQNPHGICPKRYSLTHSKKKRRKMNKTKTEIIEMVDKYGVFEVLTAMEEIVRRQEVKNRMDKILKIAKEAYKP